MSELRNIEWFKGELARLGIQINDDLDVELSGDFSAKMTLNIGHKNFSNAQFILRDAGFQVGEAHNGRQRFLHVVWDNNHKPDVFKSMGFDDVTGVG